MATTRNRRIILASSVGLLQRVAQLVATLITLPLVLHSLGVAGFGVWGAATSLAWLSGMLDLGLGSALVTLLPRGGDSRGYVAAALYGGCGLAVLVLGGGLAVVIFGLTIRPAFWLAGVALALNIPLSIAANIWLGLQKGHVGALWQLVQTLLTLVLLFAATFAGAGVAVMVAMVYGAMLLSNAGSLAHILLRHAKLRPGLSLHLAALREVLTQGGLMFVITVAASFAYVFDNLMALDWLGANASAQMTIALRVCTTATGLIGVMTQPFWPGFADAIAAEDRGWQLQTLRYGTLVTLGLAAAGGACLVAFGAPMLRWWLHQDLHMTAPLLWAMAAWIVFMCLPHMPVLLMHAALRLWPQIFILSSAAVAGFALKFYAAKSFGVMGILSVAPLLWLFFVGPAYFYLAWRWISAPQRRRLMRHCGS